MENKQTSKFIYFCGPDGTGKSTQINLLTDYFDKESIPFKYYYFRYPRIFSRIFLLIGKILKYTSYERYGEVNLWYHEFYKSRIFSELYARAFLLDVLIIWNIKRIKSRKYEYVILDRFVLDIVVDVCLETGQKNLFQKRLGRSFINAIPKNSNIILLIADYSILNTRRKDLMYDRWLKDRISLYRNLANHLDINTIDAGLNISKIHNMIIGSIINEN